MSSEVESLRAVLVDVWPEAQQGDSRAITKALTRAVRQWARSGGHRVEQEVRIEVPGYVSKAGNKRSTGYLDFVITCGGEHEPRKRIALEIDRSNKRFSVAKLVAALDEGFESVWIKWGTPVRVDVPSQVHLVQLHFDASERHDHSLPVTTFVTRPQEPVATSLRPATATSDGAPTVRVDFHEPVWGPDPRSDDLLRADRHYLQAASIRQDSQDTLFLQDSGEITYRWPTSKIRAIEWVRSSPPASRPSGGPKVDQERNTPSPIADVAGTPRTPGASGRSRSTLGLTDEQLALREKFLKMAGGGSKSPNWDGALYRSLMDEAGIPRWPTAPTEKKSTSQAGSSLGEPPHKSLSTAERASASWTEQEEEALINSAAAGMSLEEIAQAHQRSENAIRVRFKKLGILASDATIVRLFNEGWTIEELAELCREEPAGIRAQFIRSGINLERSASTEVRDPKMDHASAPPPEPECPDQGFPISDAAASGDECKHLIPLSQCSTCQHDGKPDVFVTAGGSAFHSNPQCSALQMGQRSVERRGGDSAEIERVSRSSMKLAERQPCIVCKP